MEVKIDPFDLSELTLENNRPQEPSVGKKISASNFKNSLRIFGQRNCLKVR
jgi:hypothetical protein